MSSSSEENPDSSFNDSELADIMAEIEGLEKEAIAGNLESAPASAPQAAAPAPEKVAEAAALEENLAVLSTENATPAPESTEPVSLQDTIDKEVEAARVENIANEKKDAPTASPNSTDTEITANAPVSSSAPTSATAPEKVLSFPARDAVKPQNASSVQSSSVETELPLFKLSFTVQKEVFCLEVSEDNGVCLTLPDGATLSVPWKKKAA